MKKTMKSKILLAVAGTAVLIAAGAYAWIYDVETVEASEIGTGNIQESIKLRGMVELEHKQKVYSELPAFVRSINVDVGDRVLADTKLAELEVEDMDIVIKKAGIDLNTSEETVRNLTSGIIPDTEKAYELQKDNYDRIKKSYETGLVTLPELDAAKGQLLEAEMALQNARYQLKIAKQNAAQAELQLKDAEENLGKVRIMSGINGVILNKYIDENCAVQPGTPLFEVGDTGEAYVRIDVLAEDAVRVKIGQKALISGEAAGSRSVEGEVGYIAPKADTKISSLGVEQQRVEVRIRFDDAGLSQKPGYDAEVEIFTQSRNALNVPADSVFDSDGKDCVFIVRDGRLELRSIKTGLENSRLIEVTSGLEEGDYVVSGLKNSLRPGQKVKILDTGVEN